jgi:hypothetical protein
MRAPTYTAPIDAVSLLKVGRELIEVSRDLAVELEKEGLVVLVDDGAELSGTYVPTKGIKAAAIRKRLKESSHDTDA